MKKTTLSKKDRGQLIEMVEHTNKQIQKSSNGNFGMQAKGGFPSSDPCSGTISMAGAGMQTDFTLTKYKRSGGFFGGKILWMAKGNIKVQGQSHEGYIVGKFPPAVWQEVLNAMAAARTGKPVALMTKEQAQQALTTL